MARKNRQLTPMQTRFIHEYQIDMNATQAAIRAGYSKKTAYSQGQRLLKNVEIKLELQHVREKINEKTLLTALETELALDKIIKFNLKDFVNENGEPKAIHELTNEQTACVRELGIIETQIGTHRSLKFYDKIQAIKLKMQRLGMFKEKSPTSDEDGDDEPFEHFLERMGRGRNAKKV